MEKDKHGNQKLFYKVLKSLRKGKQNSSTHIKSKDGKLIGDEKSIMSRWKEYFEDMLNIEISSQENTTRANEEGNTPNAEQFGNAGKITVEEVLGAVKLLKRGKAPGCDGITTEMVKNLGKHGIDMLTNLFNLVWKEEKIPEEWELGILLPIYKKGDKRECSNYRGISMLCVISKVYERILENRLKEIVESQLEEAQSGFRKGRGVQDHIFTIKQLIEKNPDQNIFAAFIDLEKAFDSVPRKIIWNSLRKRKVNDKLRNNITSMYKNTRNIVQTGNMKSEEFLTREGLRQGGVLSPTLFNIILDDVLKEIKEKIKTLPVGYRNMEIIRIAECAFADDIVIYARNEQELQHNLEVWNKYLLEKNLKINPTKTKVMVIGKDDLHIEIKLNDEKLEQTEIFKYLGVKLHKNGKNEAEINDRIENATKLYYSLNNTFIRKKEISKETKISVYNTIFKPILTYGCESWVLNNRTKSKIQAMEMRYLRGVKGITRADKIRNELVRDELKVEPLLKSIERQQLKWFGHIVRMDEKRQPKRIWQARTIHKRSRGRPRKTWDNEVAENLENRGLTWNEGKVKARSRKEWRKWIHST